MNRVRRLEALERQRDEERRRDEELHKQIEAEIAKLEALVGKEAADALVAKICKEVEREMNERTSPQTGENTNGKA